MGIRAPCNPRPGLSRPEPRAKGDLALPYAIPPARSAQRVGGCNSGRVVLHLRATALAREEGKRMTLVETL